MNKDYDPRPIKVSWVTSQTLVQIADAMSLVTTTNPFPLPFFDLLALAGFPCSQQCSIMPNVRSHFLHHLFRVNWNSYHEALAMMPIIETAIAAAALKSADGKLQDILASLEADGLRWIEGKVHRISGSRVTPWELF